MKKSSTAKKTAPPTKVGSFFRTKSRKSAAQTKTNLRQAGLVSKANEIGKLPFSNGYVFHCNDATETGCMDFSVFGSGNSDFQRMKENVQPKQTCLFLYNIKKSRIVQGIFIATSPCEKRICNEVDWVQRYPSQVFVKQIYKSSAIHIAKWKAKQKTLDRKDVEKMIVDAGVNVATLIKSINNTVITEVFPFYKNLNIKSRIIVILDFSEAHYNYDHPCKRLIRFEVSREDDGLNKLHSYVEKCLLQSGMKKFYYLKTKQKRNTQPMVILKDFSMTYLGWESHTSPEIQVVEVKDKAALRDATMAAKTAFMDWQTSSSSEQKIKFAKEILKCLNITDLTKMSNALQNIAKEILSCDNRFESVLNVLGWNGIGFKFPSGNCNPVIVDARKATLRYLNDLSKESKLSASLFLEFAEIIAEHNGDNSIDKSKAQENIPESDLADNKKDVKRRARKVNVDKMATLGDIAKNISDDKGTYVAISNENGDIVKALLKTKPQEKGRLKEHSKKDSKKSSLLMKTPSTDSVLPLSSGDEDAADSQYAREALLSLTSSSIDSVDKNLRCNGLADGNFNDNIGIDFSLNGGYINAFHPGTPETKKTGSVWGNPGWGIDIPKLKRVRSPPGFPSLAPLPSGPDRGSDEEDEILLMANNWENYAGSIGSRPQNHHGKMELTLDGMKLSQEKKSSVIKPNGKSGISQDNKTVPLTVIARRVETMKTDATHGFMFECNNETYKECVPDDPDGHLSYGLFGSGSKRFQLMQENIEEYTPLFLANYRTKEVCGPFFSVGRPEKNINASAFGGRFPAQVQVMYDSNVFSKQRIETEYFNTVVNKDNPILEVYDVNKLFEKLKKPYSFKIKPDKSLFHKMKEPLGQVEYFVDILMKRSEVRMVKEVTENPFIVVDAQNVVYHTEAPGISKEAGYNKLETKNDVGKSILAAIRSLMDNDYLPSNILFVACYDLGKKLRESYYYDEIMRNYKEMISILSPSEGTVGDDLCVIRKALEIAKEGKGRPVILSCDSFEKEKEDRKLVGEKKRRYWFRQWLDKHRYSFYWHREKLSFSKDPPPPENLMYHKEISYVHVDPMMENLRLNCVDAIVSKIEDSMKQRLNPESETFQTCHKKSHKVISNWIFDCSREGTLNNDNGLNHNGNESAWTVKSYDVQQSMKFGVDPLLPDRSKINGFNFLNRLSIEFSVDEHVGTEIFNSIMHIIENFKKQLRSITPNSYMQNIFKKDFGRTTRLYFDKNKPLEIFSKYYMHLKEAHRCSRFSIGEDTYAYDSQDKHKYNLVDRRIYSMLQRYDTLWKSNSGAQGALPDKVFDVLRKYLHVEGECFASPLNRRLKKFYSAFPDTDQCFGSLGSFFSPNNSRMVGSWECNPPFDVKSVKNTIDKIKKLLETAESHDEALSFAVFFAQFSSQSEVMQSVRKLQKFNRAESTVVDHVYLYGFQHKPNRGGDKHWKPDRPTSVFLFQSSFGFLKYCHGKRSEAENILRKIKMEFNQPLRV